MADRTRRDRWKTPAVLAGSVALHAVVLGALGLRAVQMTEWRADAPVVLIDIQPRPLLRDEVRREPRFAAAPAEAASGAEATAPRVPKKDEEDGLTAPSPRAPAVDADGRVEDGIDEAWRVPTRPTGRQVGRSLRGSMIGCDAMNGRLSAGEQAQCDAAFNRVAGAAPPLSGSGDAARDARFAAEGARQIEAYEGRRRPLAGGVGRAGTGDCPGSNFGTGCPGAHLDRGWRRDANDEMTGAQGGYAR